MWSSAARTLLRLREGGVEPGRVEPGDVAMWGIAEGEEERTWVVLGMAKPAPPSIAPWGGDWIENGSPPVADSGLSSPCVAPCVAPCVTPCVFVFLFLGMGRLAAMPYAPPPMLARSCAACIAACFPVGVGVGVGGSVGDSDSLKSAGRVLVRGAGEGGAAVAMRDWSKGASESESLPEGSLSMLFLRNI